MLPCNLANGLNCGVMELALGWECADEESCLEFAEKNLEVAESIFSSDSSKWEQKQVLPSVVLESTKATGPQRRLKASKSNLFRMRLRLYGKTPEEMYDFLSSKEGYKFLDPDANEEDFDQALLGPFDWARSSSGAKGRTQVEYAALDLPFPMKNRDYIILNSFDAESKTFLSASCSSPQLMKGASPIDLPGQKARTSKNGRIRLTFMGAYRAEVDREEPNGCYLHVAQYADINGWVPSSMGNFAMKAWFPAFAKRALERFKQP